MKPIPKSFYTLSVAEVSRVLDVRTGSGLASSDVRDRLDTYGLNQLAVRKRISPVTLFLGQFKDLLIIILLVAAVVSLILGKVEENGSLTEGILILAIVLAIAIVGFLNEYKAERTIEALGRLVGHKARVRRDGEITEVDAVNLVPGDIVLLEEGQKVPADIRLTGVVGLQANEASLTGESLPVNKKDIVIARDSPLGDQVNMVFSGTIISAGKGEGVVTGTGLGTEIGKIALLVDEAIDEETPMQRKLNQLGRQLGFGILAICALVFVIIFFLDHDISDISLVQRLLLAFTAAVALAVAAIPEGLAFVVRISLALGARRMAAKNALVRRLSAVEALGSTDIICSDKTGTLTKGEMTVRQLWASNTIYSVTGAGYGREGQFIKGGIALKDVSPLKLLLQLGLWCNNAHIANDTVLGDPTEGALIVAARKAGLHEDMPARLEEVPFSSDRKMMSTVHHQPAGYLCATKGATEVVLARCKYLLVNGTSSPLTPSLRKKILAENHRMAMQSLRVLGFAYKDFRIRTNDPKKLEKDLVFVGLQGMMDPPRVEIKEVITTVTEQSGMRVIMITGDYIETAKAVAAEIGIKGKALSGSELDKMSQEQLEKHAQEVAIYARVNPEHKIRIVRALKHHGFQVAMTGDGVNDAPAIKAADIGIAMGITGTDVAKEAADLILLDDQFLTIINAIEEGRGIFDNVRKFVNYLLSANIAEVITVLFGVVFFSKLVLSAAQLLFINIVTDGLPAVALGSDPAERGIMRYRPSHFQVSIVTSRLWLGMTIYGFLMSAILLVLFAYNLQTNGAIYAVSVTFAGMVVLEMIRLVDIRSDYRVKWSANPWLMVAIASSIVIELVVLYTPFLAEIFGVVPIGLGDWAIIAVSGFSLLLTMKLVNVVITHYMPEAPRRPITPGSAA